MLRRTRLLVLVLLALPGAARAVQEPGGIRERTTKLEVRIPMRDGVELFTSVYVPKDASGEHPILLKRTPYSVRPYGADDFPERLDNQRSRYLEEGYILAFQDVRGRYLSGGEYVNVRPYLADKHGPEDVDESSDTYDTVDWLVKNVPGNNGRVGISGVSYPGFYSSMGAIDAHPAVKAVSPQAPVSKWMAGDDFWHNGAFLLSHAFDFYIGFGQPRPEPTTERGARFDHHTPDGFEFFLELGPLPNAESRYMQGRVAFWNEILQHGQWDSFWEARDILPHLRDIRPATLVVGGWFDTENLYGALHTYQAIETQSPGAANTLVMGPWSHGQWASNDGSRLGDIDWGARTSEFYTESIEKPFFDHYLLGEPEKERAEAVVFETGANEWRFLDAWPPRDGTVRDLYLRPDGVASFDAPADGAGPAFLEYVSDPAHPVPYTAEITHWYDPGFMVEDQRFASRRPDVLGYRGEPLVEDLRVAGPIGVTLWVSTTGTDSDWIVKLIDVFPEDTPDPDPNPREVRMGGYEMLVRGDVLRGKFRDGLATPKPFEPGQKTKLEFQLQDVFHRFEKGHRIEVQVQSTWFPMIDRNPQRFEDIYAARAEDFQKATQRVWCSSGELSRLHLNVIP